MLRQIINAIIALLIVGIILYAIERWAPLDPFIMWLIRAVVVVGLLFAALFWLRDRTPDSP